MSPARCALVLVVMLAAIPSSAAAQVSKPILHKVDRGDSLELLAAEYYGSRHHAIFIMKANRMTHSRPLKPGETLNIPISVDVTVRVGDTLDGLAATHLGDERRASFLAEFNQLDPADSVAAGQKIIIPFHVTHTAEGKVTLRDLSLAYFGSAKYKKLLGDYNFLSSSTVGKGQKVIIPIVHVRVRPSKLPKLDDESAALATKRREEQEKAKSRLTAAAGEWRSGRYRKVLALLTDIDTDFLDAMQAVGVGVLLGSAYVAIDDKDSARSAFKKALERRKSFSLTRYYHAPKIIKVWEDAGGTVE